MPGAVMAGWLRGIPMSVCWYFHSVVSPFHSFVHTAGVVFMFCWRRAQLVIPREWGLRYDAGTAVPVLMS